jgi:hypothetical protein
VEARNKSELRTANITLPIQNSFVFRIATWRGRRAGGGGKKILEAKKRKAKSGKNQGLRGLGVRDGGDLVASGG